jgi:tetratricopeptide (TPR) repeat protein
MDADKAKDFDRYIQLVQAMLQIRLRAYKPESPPIGAAWCLVGSAYFKASRLQEAKEATEKSLEVYTAANDEDDAALAREQLGLIFEGMGQLADAKEIRLRGASEGMMVCSSLQVLQKDYGWR